jgi:hypothetical protein
MNEFTKEELQSIVSSIKSLRIYTEIENWEEELLDKVQTMIDNYCEHEWENICSGCDLGVICCMKCDKAINEL